ncbi:DNA-directed RNA polymerase subunit omega [Actinobaculum suis]|uniref:DNA-directed RNA polymerase subunit omega n=1 Tax=Actinobaculum suis TaxID=1657 RepID=A0A7Z8Y9D5_9ACTO|nr:DNA-directed RNA polymerase subunit omega [Actinobaculum suis]VDG76438.1 DNA-directed RNA polymerase subunit omega [Actinobaculum suis]
MFGTVPEPEGITRPPIDDLLAKIPSKYALCVVSSQRAQQINTYRQEMARGDANITSYGALVAADPEEKPLSIALRELVDGKLDWTIDGHGPQDIVPEAELAAGGAAVADASEAANAPAPTDAAAEAETAATEADAPEVADEAQ